MNFTTVLQTNQWAGLQGFYSKFKSSYCTYRYFPKAKLPVLFLRPCARCSSAALARSWRAATVLHRVFSLISRSPTNLSRQMAAIPQPRESSHFTGIFLSPKITGMLGFLSTLGFITAAKQRKLNWRENDKKLKLAVFRFLFLNLTNAAVSIIVFWCKPAWSKTKTTHLLNESKNKDGTWEPVSEVSVFNLKDNVKTWMLPF